MHYNQQTAELREMKKEGEQLAVVIRSTPGSVVGEPARRNHAKLPTHLHLAFCSLLKIPDIPLKLNDSYNFI